MTKSEIEVLLELIRKDPDLRPTMVHPKNPDMTYVISDIVKVTNHQGEWTELVGYYDEADVVLYARPIDCFGKFTYLGTYDPNGKRVH